MNNTEPRTDAEVLRLGAIYRRCIDDLEGIAGCDIRAEHYDRVIERFSEAVGEALEVLTQRCPKCDGSTKVMCWTCWREEPPF